MREKDKRSELLSIGEMAKITGVNIKSLRYYEQVGVLLPVYINPDSGYRYYSLAQVSAVELIQACVEIGLPLKELHRFSDPNNSIDYLSFLSYSEELMKQKIELLQQNLKGMQEVKEEIKLLKKYRHSKKQHIRQLSEKYLYVFLTNRLITKRLFIQKQPICLIAQWKRGMSLYMILAFSMNLLIKTCSSICI